MPTAPPWSRPDSALMPAEIEVNMLAALEPTMRTAMAELYAVHFTDAELADIAAFFATTSGATYARQSYALASDPRLLSAVFSEMPTFVGGMMVTPALTFGQRTKSNRIRDTHHGLHIRPSRHQLHDALGTIGHGHGRMTHADHAGGIQLKGLQSALEAAAAIGTPRIAFGQPPQKGKTPITLGVQAADKIRSGLGI